jgi:hypothetical protein
MVASARGKKRKGKVSMKETFGENENVVFYEEKGNVVFYEGELRKKGKCCFLCFVAYEKKGRCFFAFGSKKEISSTSKHFSYISERLRIYYKV